MGATSEVIFSSNPMALPEHPELEVHTYFSEYFNLPALTRPWIFQGR